MNSAPFISALADFCADIASIEDGQLFLFEDGTYYWDKAFNLDPDGLPGETIELQSFDMAQLHFDLISTSAVLRHIKQRLVALYG